MQPEVAAVLAARARDQDLILATSGSTGAPRRVVRTTESWWASFAAYSELSGVDAGARLWIPGPLTSTMNLFAAVHATAVGAELADLHKATHAVLTPARLARDGAELPAGLRVTVAGAPLSAAQVAAHSRLRVAHYYGAAELSFVASGTHADDLVAFAGVELDVRDGEIWVRSAYLASGYAEGSSPGALRRDGSWATVGDRGTQVNGRLRVFGRPDAITTAGATVPLADVEQALLPLASGTLVVFGLPHSVLGEVLAAVVTNRDDVPRLRQAAWELLSQTHRPRLWFETSELPLTSAEKPDRPALARLAAAGDLVRIAVHG